MKNKSYIGDGVYVHVDGENVWLEAGGMANDRNRIALNSDNWPALLQYLYSHLPRLGGAAIIEVPSPRALIEGYRRLQEDLNELAGEQDPDVIPTH